MTESDMIEFLTRSYDEFLQFNEAYIASPQKRKDRARLLADHKRWKTERERMIAEWRATRQPTATE